MSATETQDAADETPPARTVEVVAHKLAVVQACLLVGIGRGHLPMKTREARLKAELAELRKLRGL